MLALTARVVDQTRRRVLGSEAVAERYGAAPDKAAFDGGYASKENLDAAKALGVEHRGSP